MKRNLGYFSCLQEVDSLVKETSIEEITMKTTAQHTVTMLSGTVLI